MARINEKRLIADLRRLAEFGKFGSGVDRVSFSAPDIDSRAWLFERMKEAGLDAAIDPVGNVRGLTMQASRSVVIGSHTDSVPKGGWLDGAMGVLYGLEIARSRIESGRGAMLGVDVVSFQDEEGTFLPCLGRRSFCGDLTETDIAKPKSRWLWVATCRRPCCSYQASVAAATTLSRTPLKKTSFSGARFWRPSSSAWRAAPALRNTPQRGADNR